MFQTIPPSEECNGSTAFHERLAPIASLGYINCHGEVAIRNGAVRRMPFSEGLAAVADEESNGFGYIDPSGHMAIGPELWASIGTTFDHECAQITVDKHSRGLIDHNGDWIVRPTSRSVFEQYQAGWIVTLSDNRRILKHLKSGVVIEREVVEQIHRFEDDVWVGTRADFPNSYGWTVFTVIAADGTISGQFTSRDDIGDVHGRFSDGLMPFRAGDDMHFGFVNKRGEIQIAPTFRFAYPFRDGLAPVAMEDGPAWGYIDCKGEWQIAASEKWILADCFHEGAAAVLVARRPEHHPRNGEFIKGDKWGYITREGGWLLPPVFEMARPFREGLAHVRFDYFASPINKGLSNDSQNSGQCYLNQAGTFIWPPDLAGRNIHEFIVELPNEMEIGKKLQVVIPGRNARALRNAF